MQAPSARRGLMIAAPASGSGKTVVTLGLLRAMKDHGVGICGAKAGPDYIDPAFHEAASGHPSVNLDPWAMGPERLRQLFHAQPQEMVLVEAMMGLFDAAVDGSGSPADLAIALGLPVVLVIDCARQSHSVAALAKGFRDHRPGLVLAGVILIRIGSARHETMLRQALEETGIAVLGAVPRAESLALPERHLGLVQAGEHSSLEAFIANAARMMAETCDLAAMGAAFAAARKAVPQAAARQRAPGQWIAIARDQAFSFIYPHLVSGWRECGAGISFFSPLAGEGPDPDADAVYLPGGYPELHAGAIAGSQGFRDAMGMAARRGAMIHGECGGYMVLGKGLTDKDGRRHAMLGLLDLETSFAERKLHLGYRRLRGLCGGFEGEFWAAHEFHYSVALREEGEPLFEARDASGASLGNAGLRRGTVTGSYMHLIDRAEP